MGMENQEEETNPTPDEEEQKSKYHVDMYDEEQWGALVKEEEGKWEELGIDLNMLTFSNWEHFHMQCRLQAIVNSLIDGLPDTEEGRKDVLNRNLKMIILESMEGIRENIEPQIKEAKLAMLQAKLAPKPRIQMPWERPGNDPRNN